MPIDPIPHDYIAWRHCIEVDCQLSLTAAYITQRLSALRNAHDHHTQQFIRRWGGVHHEQVINWFERAYLELE